MHVVSVVPKCQKSFWIIALCFILRILKIHKPESHSSGNKKQVIAISSCVGNRHFCGLLCFFEGF